MFETVWLMLQASADAHFPPASGHCGTEELCLVQDLPVAQEIQFPTATATSTSWQVFFPIHRCKPNTLASTEHRVVCYRRKTVHGAFTPYHRVHIVRAVFQGQRVEQEHAELDGCRLFMCILQLTLTMLSGFSGQRRFRCGVWRVF